MHSEVNDQGNTPPEPRPSRSPRNSSHLPYYSASLLFSTNVPSDHCNECAIYQTSKPSNEHPLDQTHPIPTDEPLHTLSMDYITSLPLSDGKDALLTFTDKFTKAIRLVPCNKTTSAEDAAR